jgi:branched-chain amino acid transport system permease protein
VVGGIVVGEILSITTLFDPAYAQAAIYAVMTLVLILRPRGLFGTMGRA